ncbi:DUF2818 family protein [Variovorax dokdonensis]|uniref:DUF2818 family protein n=1 Tax=Variovorax dokdonensis TaxID=344883 RepID=A0ABT7NF13_9BURK|nr:DUF2818 family protein [Variovorax dokdonensis]MDM0046415.1 DUF2818 family protein [Variovorax dokdonensis]
MTALNASVWVVLALALLGANLPFLNDRLMAVVPLGSAHKSLPVRLAELVVLFFVVGGVGMLFEKRLGQNFAQGWEFYAVSAALFLVLAFPGFTWRYLLKHRS